jgi:pyridoxamine 5'-phosphate oxidase
LAGDARDTRREYGFGALRRAMLAQSPHDQFAAWMDAAVRAQLRDTTAMALATASGAGKPGVRIVLLKHFDANGYCWYTDLGSHKAADLSDNLQAELLFYWREFDRQIRISGTVERLADAEVDAYFTSRPLASKLSAAASSQSSTIEDRAALEAEYDRIERQHPDGDVPRPERWGGFRLVAETFEFWQGRKGRLHDRFRYAIADQDWQIERLQP